MSRDYREECPLCVLECRVVRAEETDVEPREAGLAEEGWVFWRCGACRCRFRVRDGIVELQDLGDRD